MANKRMRRNPQKTWYWIPFTAAILIFIISVSQVMDMIIPKADPWAPPDSVDLAKAVGWSVITILVFILQGINGLYHYKEQKGDED